MLEDSAHTVPHLTTALSGPLRHLEQYLLNHQTPIEAWFREQWRKTPPPFYGSIDLRNAGFKLAPVDTNLFPAGFNNLNPDFMPLCIQAAQATLESAFPGCLRLLLIPENHTRNVYYLENIATLQTILSKAGFEVHVGSLLDGLTTTQTLTLPSNRTLLLEPVVRQGDRLTVAGYNACVIILNNDLSSGVPSLLQGVKQAITPPLAMGWNMRTKSNHFKHYATVCDEFAALLNIDAWLINPLYRQCENIDFMTGLGEASLVENAESLFTAITDKYQTYDIKHKPFVVVKADAGTYGMGVMTIESARDLIHLNRKQRSKMATSKGNISVNRVILQEGIYTFETWGKDNAVAEPVIYAIGQYIVGGFYRVHTQRGINENLNAPGMHFEPLAFAESCNNPDHTLELNDCPNRFYAYGVIARLALIAAAREINEVKYAT